MVRTNPLSRSVRLLLIGLFAMVFATPAFPQTFHVSVAGLGDATGSTPQSLLDGLFTGSLGTTGMASASADRGLLRAKSACENPVSCLCTPQIDPALGGTAELHVFDALIVGPPEVTEIATVLHLVLDGTLALAGPSPWGGRLEVTVACGTGGGFGYIVLSGDGLLSGGILAGQATPSVSRVIDLATTVPVNAPFAMSISMVAVVGGTSLGTTVNSAAVNFFDGAGLHFPATVPLVGERGHLSSAGADPVFTLPDGYTSEIPSLNVVDNVWTTGNPVPTENTTWGRVKNLHR